MNEQERDCLVIHSIAEDGKRFRPSDWIERISASMARFGTDRRLRYSEMLHPVMIGDEKCLFVSARLQQLSPPQFEHIMAFAAANHLWVEREGCLDSAA